MFILALGIDQRFVAGGDHQPVHHGGRRDHAVDPFLRKPEAARNLTCSGARPLAVTDNLSFGNPHNPELFWRLRESVEGLAEGCREFGTPVTGGNVSFYNESPVAAVDPTPKPLGPSPVESLGPALNAAQIQQALVGNTGFRRYLKTISDEHFAIDPDKIEEDQKFDGIFVLRTNTDLNPLEAMLCYKQL